MWFGLRSLRSFWCWLKGVLLQIAGVDKEMKCEGVVWGSMEYLCRWSSGPAVYSATQDFIGAWEDEGILKKLGWLPDVSVFGVGCLLLLILTNNSNRTGRGVKEPRQTLPIQSTNSTDQPVWFSTRANEMNSRHNNQLARHPKWTELFGVSGWQWVNSFGFQICKSAKD
jgi:hypothetical protein